MRARANPVYRSLARRKQDRANRYAAQTIADLRLPERTRSGGFDFAGKERDVESLSGGRRCLLGRGYGNQFIYLQYGLLKALKVSPDGREQVLRFISAGEIFNEVGALAKRSDPATAIALEESGIWLIPRQA